MSDSNEEDKPRRVAKKKTGAADALSNVLSKILGEDTGRKAAPVLAKRKTEAMRMIEEEAEKNALLRAARIQKREEQHKQQRQPHEYDIEHERLLRKIATKGVVALFNAISTAKKAREESGVPLPVSRQQEKLNRRREGQLRKQQADRDRAAGITPAASSSGATGKVTGASTTAAPAPAAAGASAAGAAAGSGWAVLSDDIGASHKLAASLYHTAGNTNSALKNAGKRNKADGSSASGGGKRQKSKHWDEDDGDDDY